MTILQIMPQFPFPPVDGGKVALANVALHFAKQGHRVHLVCFRSTLQNEYDEQLLKKGIEVHPIVYTPSNTALRILGSLFNSRSLYMQKHDTEELNNLVDRILSTEEIDVIHADHTCMASVAFKAAQRHDLPWGFRSNNMEWLIWQRYAETISKWNPKRWYLLDQARKVKSEEYDLLRKASAAFTITKTDAEQLATEGIQCVVAQAGVDPEAWILPRPVSNDLRVTMASNYNWIHNVDALRWFLDSVWVHVHGKIPQSTFHVYGVNTPGWLSGYAGNGVVNEGFVEDLAHEYSKASLSVAPLFVGSGFRLKIIEALAAGLPVVATTLSAEGIGIDGENGLIRVDDSDAMIDEICKLLKNADRRRSIGAAGQHVVTTEFTWAMSVSIMLDTYQKLLPAE